MIKSFVDLKIGKKLGLVFGAGILQLAMLLGFALWAIHTTSEARIHVEAEARMMDLADKVASDLDGIAARLSYVANSNDGDPQSLHEIEEHRKEYRNCFKELKELSQSESTQAELLDLERAVSGLREINQRVLTLASQGKREEANRLINGEAHATLSKADTTINEYVNRRDADWKKSDQELDALTSRVTFTLIAVGILALVVAIPTSLLFTRSITGPLSAAVAHLSAVAAGDISRNVTDQHLGRADEIGTLSQAAQHMTVSLRDVLRSINTEIQALTSSSSQLSANSAQMSTGSRAASDKAHSVAAAAEEVSANVGSVAAGMEQAAANLGNVSSHTEEMTATISEIAGNSEKARRITEAATRQTTFITEQMSQLGAAAREIGKVTETITNISSQTNLLALNATIEAARAGASGKGFAVVAHEIKELAQQAAAATQDIKIQIQGVQNSTASSISEIAKVSQVVHEVSDIVSSIAAAIEEQATTTKNIAQNIAHASTGVKDVNQRVAETSQASREIAREIAIVDQAAIEMADGSDQVRSSAAELSKSAEHLQTLVSRFQV